MVGIQENSTHRHRAGGRSYFVLLFSIPVRHGAAPMPRRYSHLVILFSYYTIAFRKIKEEFVFPLKNFNFYEKVTKG